MECESPPAISTTLSCSLHEYTDNGDKTSVLEPHALLYPQTYTLPWTEWIDTEIYKCNQKHLLKLASNSNTYSKTKKTHSHNHWFWYYVEICFLINFNQFCLGSSINLRECFISFPNTSQSGKNTSMHIKCSILSLVFRNAMKHSAQSKIEDGVIV